MSIYYRYVDGGNKSLDSTRRDAPDPADNETADKEPSSLKSYDIEDIQMNGEAGLCAKVTCPTCHDEVHCGGWSDAICDCGLRWNVEIYAEGWPTR